MISGFCKDVFNQLPMEFAGSRQVVEPEAGRKCRLIVVGWHLARLNELRKQGRLRHGGEKRMIVENSEVVLSVRELTAEVDGTPILRGEP